MRTLPRHACGEVIGECKGGAGAPGSHAAVQAGMHAGPVAGVGEAGLLQQPLRHAHRQHMRRCIAQVALDDERPLLTLNIVLLCSRRGLKGDEGSLLTRKVEVLNSQRGLEGSSRILNTRQLLALPLQIQWILAQLCARRV